MDSKIIGYKTRWSKVGVLDYTTPTEVGPNELLVKISYIALNPIDVKKKTMALVPRTRAAGKEFSGYVQTVGSALGVEWKTGDRICGFLDSPLTSNALGTMALINANVPSIMKSPFGLNDKEAASFPLTFSTALEMLERTWKHGKLLVLGGGSNVGSFVIQLAKKKYMFTDVYATCSQRSEEYVKSLGAIPIDYTDGDLSDKLVKLGIKFDAVLDTVGGYSALRVWPQILKSYNDGGVYATIAGDATVESYNEGLVRPLLTSLPWMMPRALLGKQLGINYQFVLKKSIPWTKTAAEFFAENGSRIRIASQYDLYDCGKAWDHVESVGGGGKVLICMDSYKGDI